MPYLCIISTLLLVFFRRSLDFGTHQRHVKNRRSNKRRTQDTKQTTKSIALTTIRRLLHCCWGSRQMSINLTSLIQYSSIAFVLVSILVFYFVCVVNMFNRMSTVCSDMMLSFVSLFCGWFIFESTFAISYEECWRKKPKERFQNWFKKMPAKNMQVNDRCEIIQFSFSFLPLSPGVSVNVWG